MNRDLLANLAAAAAAFSAGASVVATRLAVGEADPAALVVYRYVLAVACLAPVLPALWPKARIPAAELAKIALFGAVFFGVFPWAFNAALQYTTAARGAIGLATIPIQTLIVASLFGRERLALARIASVALAFAGVALVFGREALAAAGPDRLIGDGLMLFAAFSAAVASVFGRPLLARHGPTVVTALAMAFGAAAFFPLALGNGALASVLGFSRDAWLALLFLGTVGGALQFVLFNWALRVLPPSRTVIYLTLNPITAMLLGAALLGEVVTATLLAGLALVLAGILVANLPPMSFRALRAGARQQ